VVDIIWCQRLVWQGIALSRKRTVRELIEPLSVAKTLVNIHLPQSGGLDGDLSNRLQGVVWQMDSGGVYPGLPLRESNNPCARPHIRLFSRRGADGASLCGVSICGSRKDYYYYYCCATAWDALVYPKTNYYLQQIFVKLCMF
jgi:hypothetical protein